MNINDLKLFKSICETHNYTHTSKIFFISQPAVTAAVKRLEEDLGTTLFHRSRFQQDVTLTQTGELFRKHVYQILKQLSQAYTEIKTFEHRKPVRFGLPPMIGAYYFTSKVPGLFKTNILSLLKITEDGSEGMLRKLLLGKIDMGIIGSLDPEFAHEGLQSIRLASFPFKLIVSQISPLAKQEKVTFNQIKGLNFISMKSDFLHHSLLFQLFKKHHEKLKVISQTDQIQTYKSLIASGAGIGLITEMAIDRRSDTFVPLTLDEPDLPEFNVFLCYPKDRYLTEVEQQVIELLSTK